jgi:hypothetical protein
VYGSRERSRVRIVGRAALIAAVAWLVCGCAAPRNHLYRKSGANFERAIVLPLNLVVSMPKELAGGAGRVEKTLHGYLAERGKAIETMKFADAIAAWRASEAECRSQGAKGCDRFAGVARFMAQRLRRNHDYQTLIIPYVFLRTARSTSSAARWHGVERPVEKSGSGFGPEGRARLVRGDILAASLKVFAFSPEGEKVFEGVGGLDLVDRVRADDYGFYYTEVRENVLADPEMLREGVALALEPLVPRSKAAE